VSKRIIALLAALAALALIVAGCGGGSSSTESTSSLSKAEFLKEGNAVCAKGNEEIEETFESFAKEHNLSEKNPPSEDELQEVASEILPIISNQIEGVRDVGIPSEGGQGIEDALNAAEEALEEAEEDPTAFTGEKDDPFKKANKMATEVGLTACGEE
jgi:hypothetical protein